MDFKLKKPDMVQEAAKTGGKNVVLEILMFVGLFFVAILVENLIFMGVEMVTLFTQPEVLEATQSGDLEKLLLLEQEFLRSDAIMILQLFLTLVMTGMTMLFCKVIQKRRMRTLGFKKPGMWKEYGT